MIFFDVDADPELQRLILEAGAKFWEHIENREPPPPLESGDVIDLPPAKGGEVVKVDSPEWIQTVRDLQQAREIKLQAEELEKDAKEKLQALMGDNQIVEGGDARVYWTLQERSSFDSKAFKKDHPDLYKRYVRQTQTRPFRPFFLKPLAE
jgi:predicted phage-related endonuclease